MRLIITKCHKIKENIKKANKNCPFGNIERQKLISVYFDVLMLNAFANK